MKNILLIACLALISLPAFAQQAPPPPPDAQCPMECPPPPEHKERKMLEAVRISRMTEALTLTDDQISKFFPKLKQLEENQRELRKKHRVLVERLETMMKNKAADRDIKSKIDSIDNLRKETYRNRERIFQELDTILSLQQRAMWRVFDENFDDEIRKMVMQSRERRFRSTTKIRIYQQE